MAHPCRLHPLGRAPRGPAPLQARPILRPGPAARGRRHRPCSAGSEDGPDRPSSSANLLGQAVRWTAALVRSGLDRQAATAKRWQQAHFSRVDEARDEQPALMRQRASRDEPDSAHAERPALSPSAEQQGEADGEAESDDREFRLLPEHVPAPELDAPFSEWEEVRSAPLLLCKLM